MKYYVNSIFWDNNSETYVSHENATEFETLKEAVDFFENCNADGDPATDGHELWKIVYDDEGDVVDHVLLLVKFKEGKEVTKLPTKIVYSYCCDDVYIDYNRKETKRRVTGDYMEITFEEYQRNKKFQPNDADFENSSYDIKVWEVRKEIVIFNNEGEVDDAERVEYYFSTSEPIRM